MIRHTSTEETSIGIFATLKGLRTFVAKKYPEFKLENDGNYILTHIKSNISNNTYLTIYEEPLKE